MKYSLSLAAACAMVVAGLATERDAHAHARLVEPKPRNNSTQYKNEAQACGGQPARAATQPLTMLTAGSKLMVRFEETVNHPGCFLIDFAPAGDANWVELANVKHVGTAPNPSDARPRQYMKEVTLPGEACTACTIRVRQVMMESRGGEAAACPPTPLTGVPTYYSCANVVMMGGGGSTPADGGTPTPVDAGGAGGSGGGAGGSSGSAGGSSGSAGGSTGSSGGSTGSSGSSGSPGSTGTGGSPSGGSAGGASGTPMGSGASTGSARGGTGGTKPTSSTADGSSVGCTMGGKGNASYSALAGLLLALALIRRRRR